MVQKKWRIAFSLKILSINTFVYKIRLLCESEEYTCFISKDFLTRTLVQPSFVEIERAFDESLFDITYEIDDGGYAIYDINTDTGWFAGIVGVLILCITIPVFAVLLLADFIVWIIRQKNNLKF